MIKGLNTNLFALFQGFLLEACLVIYLFYVKLIEFIFRFAPKMVTPLVCISIAAFDGILSH